MVPLLQDGLVGCCWVGGVRQPDPYCMPPPEMVSLIVTGLSVAAPVLQ